MLTTPGSRVTLPTHSVWLDPDSADTRPGTFARNIIRVIESQDVRLSEEVIADRILKVNNV